jgi:Arc/MetJ-type ribon-helix-helix transcriptional regulator
MKEHLSVTVPRDVADMVEELKELTGWDKSRCVSEALRIGLPELIKKYKKKKKADKPTTEDEERAREEYWRKVILGEIHGDKWVPV